MKRIKLLSILLLAATLILSSCAQQDDIEYSAPLQQNEERSSALEVLENFRKAISTNKEKPLSTIGICDIENKYFTRINNHPIEVAYAQSRSNNEITTFTTITFVLNGKNGYAIIGESNDTKEVLFYTENGEISDTSFIAPLKNYMTSHPYSFPSDLGPSTSEDPVDTTLNTSHYFIPNIVKTTWGQGMPYNNHIPVCTDSTCSSYGRHKKVGCAGIAVGQLIAKCGHYKGTLLPKGQLNFALMTSTTTPTAQTENIIALFLAEVTQGLKTQYGCYGSSTSVSAIPRFLKAKGYDYTEISGLDIDLIKQNLEAGIPILATGQHPEGGHAWLITGIFELSTDNYSFYCNWGWEGASDAWIHGNPYTVNKYLSFKDRLATSYIAGFN